MMKITRADKLKILLGRISRVESVTAGGGGMMYTEARIDVKGLAELLLEIIEPENDKGNEKVPGR